MISAVTTCASLLYVMKRPHLDGGQKLTVLALAVLAGVPVSYVLFVLLSLVNIMRFWDTGIWDTGIWNTGIWNTGIGSDVVFLYFSAPMAVLLSLMLVLITSMINAGAAPKTETVRHDTSVTAGPVAPDAGRLLLTGTIAVAVLFLLIVVATVAGFFWWNAAYSLCWWSSLFCLL